MKKNRAYVFRLKPNNNQSELINKTIGSARYVYNHFLAERKNAYENDGNALTYKDCSKQLTLLKNELIWLKEVDAYDSLEKMSRFYRMEKWKGRLNCHRDN